jgi:hypothetical protein
MNNSGKVIVTWDNQLDVNSNIYVSQGNLSLGTIAGQVVDRSKGNPIWGVKFKGFSGDSVIETTSTDASGNYSISIEPGSYTVKASKRGYIAQSQGVVVSPRVLSFTK